MRTAVIIQARMGSARLPGKCGMALAKRPLLDHVIERVQAASIGTVVVATSTGPKDNAILPIAQRRMVPVWRGSERDVLGRIAEAAAWIEADVIVRVTADCCFWDPTVAQAVVEAFANPSLAPPDDDRPDRRAIDLSGAALAGPPLPRARPVYVSNDTACSGYPDGTDVEIFTRAALDQAAAQATKAEDREHVTRWMRVHLPTGMLRCPDGDFSRYKFSVDTPNDYQLARQIADRLAPGDFAYRSVIEAYDACTAQST